MGLWEDLTDPERIAELRKANEHQRMQAILDSIAAKQMIALSPHELQMMAASPGYVQMCQPQRRRSGSQF